MSAADELRAAAADYARHHSPETQSAWRDQQAQTISHGNEAGGSWGGNNAPQPASQSS